MKDYILVDPDIKLWVLINQARAAMFAVEEKELRQYGISAMRAAVLFVVQLTDNKATPAEISRWLLRRSHSVSGLLQRMETDGLIKKVNDLDRRNVKRVVITEKGQQIYKQLKNRKVIRRIISSLSEEQHQQLTLYLKKLRDRSLKELGTDLNPYYP